LVGCRLRTTVSYPRIPAPNRTVAYRPIAVIYMRDTHSSCWSQAGR